MLAPTIKRKFKKKISKTAILSGKNVFLPEIINDITKKVS